MSKPRELLATTMALVVGCAGQTAHSSPGRMSAEGLARVASRVSADIARGRIPGVVMMVKHDGKLVLKKAIGKQDPAADTPMREDSIFRIYSMTKPVVSVAAMILVERGQLLLSDPVSKHIPELRGLKVGVEKDGALELVPARREPTIQDLLCHTSGFTGYSHDTFLVNKLYEKSGVDRNDHTNAELVTKLAGLPLKYQPGTTWEYGRSADVLGHVLERVTGQPLDEWLQASVFGPLGMTDTAFFVEPGKQQRIAQPFARDPDSGTPVGLDDVRQKPKYLSGGGGLVSTAADYLRFAEMLLNGGELDGVRILSRKTVDLMTSDHLGPIAGPGPGYGFGLGFGVRRASGLSPFNGSVGDYDWGGYGGTYFWVDPSERLVAVWMMQAPNQRHDYRELYRNMVYGALGGDSR